MFVEILANPNWRLERLDFTFFQLSEKSTEKKNINSAPSM